MRTPTLLQEEASPSGTTLTVRMDAQLDVFKGHFPDFPLLPGWHKLILLCAMPASIWPLTVSLPVWTPSNSRIPFCRAAQ